MLPRNKAVRNDNRMIKRSMALKSEFAMKPKLDNEEKRDFTGEEHDGREDGKLKKGHDV